ncbi:MAG: hypothetical protein KGY80_13300 [Candidatus Thorarchaeota archaeon]|nr:hypothetical protein [Candidatus Thorarchaeota archaeon]
MQYANPSVQFLDVNDTLSVCEALNDVEEEIGPVETREGEKNRYLRTSEIAKSIESQGNYIRNISRGELRFEDKVRFDEDPPFEMIKPYKVYYYVLDANNEHYTLIVANKRIQRYIKRFLKKSGIQLGNVTLGRRIQNQLVSRNDVTYYALQTDDEAEPEIGQLKAVARSPGTNILGTQGERFVDGRGLGRDQGLTWDGQGERPRLTFWIYHRGAINISHPQVNEEDLLQLVNLVISVL